MKELEEKELERVVLTQCFGFWSRSRLFIRKKGRESNWRAKEKGCAAIRVLQTPSAHKSNKGGLSLTRIINVQLSLNTHLIIIFKYFQKLPSSTRQFKISQSNALCIKLIDSHPENMNV